MPDSSIEKKALSSRVLVNTTNGDTTPTSSSGHNETMDEADKKLEAMGYTPVVHPFLALPTITDHS